jgi:ubiquinone/menaquinone biosynthesis C-methylase UbiE
MSRNAKIATIAGNQAAPATSGIVLHAPAFYDFIVWVAMHGKERDFREKVLDISRLSAGEAVLDVGCGTGTLAIAAKHRVGDNGTVCGLDASPEMLARAQKKAKKDGVEVAFQNGVVESMPFADGQFDLVLSTVMLHHLPSKARLECAREMRRVVKPSGRVLVVDFDSTANEKKGFISRLHRGHGHVTLRNLAALLQEAGLQVTEKGAVGIRDLNFVLATVPGGSR